MREIKYYSMSIHQLRQSMNVLIQDQLSLDEGSAEYKDNYVEQMVCSEVLDQREMQLLQVLKRG